MGEYLSTAVALSVFVGAIRIGTPLLLAAIGEMVTERSGILNLGIEGTLTFAAFISFVTVDRTDSLILGVLFGAFGGVFVSLVMAVLTVTFKVEQVVAGLAINDHQLLLAGAIPAAALAMLLDWVFRDLERRTVGPRAGTLIT